MKNKVKDLAIFSGKPVFNKIRSTSNLVQPSAEIFYTYAKKSFDVNHFTNNGPVLIQFERKLSEIYQSDYCLGFCSGFWAIALCIKCLAIEGKNEIIMPSFTYRRMADIAAWLGMVPNFCEVSSKTLGMTASTVEQCINENTALIMGIHPIVNLCDIDGLTQLSQDKKIPLMFDSVEAAYASHHGKMIGSFGEAECFSMHASKFINGFEGGYVTTNNPDLAHKLQRMRDFGISESGEIVDLGMNAKLSDIHAAMALASFDDLEDQIIRNRNNYHIYYKSFEEIDGIDLVEYDEVEKRTFKNILVRLNKRWPISREATIKIMHAENMLVRPYYSPPLHKKNQKYPTIYGELKLTEELSEQYLLLPCGDFTDQDDVYDIVSLLRFIQNNGNEIEEAL